MACLAPETKMKNNTLQEVNNAVQVHVNYSLVTFFNRVLLPPFAILSNDSFSERNLKQLFYFIYFITFANYWQGHRNSWTPITAGP